MTKPEYTLFVILNGSSTILYSGAFIDIRYYKETHSNFYLLTIVSMHI